MTGFALRPAAPADAPALAALGRDSFVAKFGHLYDPADLGPFLAATYGEEAIAAELANPDRLYHLAQDAHGALAGYCKLSLVCGWPEHARGSHVIELKQLYTAPEMTGRGIGGALMAWAMGEARTRGADEMQLSVWCDNHGAQKFYARHGFEKVADVTFHVGKHVDHEYLFARML